MIFEQILFNTILKVQVVHSMPGRIRLHVPYAKQIPKEWQLGHSYMDCLKVVPGVKSVEFNYVTANAVIYFDPAVISENGILKIIKDMMQLVSQHKDELSKFDVNNKDEAFDYVMDILETYIKNS